MRRVSLQGRIAYVPQEAWIQNASLQKNVLFDEPLVQHKYDAVVEACALTHDLSVLPAGDQTEIGEKVRGARNTLKITHSPSTPKHRSDLRA